MSSNFNKTTTAFLLMCSFLSTQTIVFAQTAIQYPDLSTARGGGSKGGGATAKLSPDLRILFDQFSGGSKGSSADSGAYGFSEAQLKEMYGISAGADEPMVSLAVTTSSDADIKTLKQNGMTVYMRQGSVVYGQAPVSALGRLAGERTIVKIAATKSAKSPELPEAMTPPDLMQQFSSIGSKGAAPAPLANEFNKSTLSGKGVLVGVIDSGIDWQHPDFINADGTSRILAIWDMYDGSFAESKGAIGTAGPKLDAAGEPLFGTVYTKAQIDAALKGTGKVNTLDNNGHGTAVAGTAAGNGRASAGKNAGVAPEADLIIVKASDCGGFTENWVYGAAWITQMAKNLKKPLVVNGSFGGHFNAHDGKDSEETYLNGLTGKGIPGVVFTISAGNEGRSSMHATGRFGPKRAGQADITSSPISVSIPQERVKDSNNSSMLLGLFDARDDWGMALVPSASSPLKDKDGKPMTVFIMKSAGEIKYATVKGVNVSDTFSGFMTAVTRASQLGTVTDFVTIPLPYGSYDIWGFSTSEKVVNGSFDFYAPRDRQVDFGRGTTKTHMVGSPGNAANVITVGAYNFRPNWRNFENTETVFNFPMGGISDYSSPGGQRPDGVVKPDIAAPATYTISPLSSTAGPGSTACGGGNMGAGSGPRFVTAEGKYIAWQGTSASSPFTAGVVALLLQKNPTLDAEQIRQILIKSARKGGVIGSVPNAEWGYGMLDPVAAILATPAAGKKGK